MIGTFLLTLEEFPLIYVWRQMAGGRQSFLKDKQSSEIYSSVKMSCHTGSMVTDFLCCLISVNLVLYLINSLHVEGEKQAVFRHQIVKQQIYFKVGKSIRFYYFKPQSQM